MAADTVKTGKLSPEGLDVSYDSYQVVVFEDVPAGVRAGNAAGATTIGILETQSKETVEEAGAD